MSLGWFMVIGGMIMASCGAKIIIMDYDIDLLHKKAAELRKEYRDLTGKEYTEKQSPTN